MVKCVCAFYRLYHIPAHHLHTVKRVPNCPITDCFCFKKLLLLKQHPVNSNIGLTGHNKSLLKQLVNGNTKLFSRFLFGKFIDLHRFLYGRGFLRSLTRKNVKDF